MTGTKSPEEKTMTTDHKIIIDRVVGDYAVLEATWKRDDGKGAGENRDEDRTVFELPKGMLPPGSKEGDEVCFCLSL
jgi:hypothetical protein